MDTQLVVMLPTTLAVDQDPVTVYLASLHTKKSRDTMVAMLKAVTRVVGRDIDWTEVRFQHVQAIIARMLGLGKSASMVNTALSAMRGVAGAAFDLGYISGDELMRIKRIKRVNGSTVPAGRALAQGERLALAKACAADKSAAGVRDAAILALLYSCGLRRGELVKLDLADVSEHDGALRLLIRGKGNRQRYVYVDNGALVVLRAWLATRGNAPGPLFMPVNRGGRVIRGQRLTTQAVYNVCAKRAEQAGVAGFSPHDLRRSFISDHLDAGTDIATVQRLAGHANVSTTQRYDRRPERVKREAAKALHWPVVA